MIPLGLRRLDISNLIYVSRFSFLYLAISNSAELKSANPLFTHLKS